jgi:hypothetical protein
MMWAVLHRLIVALTLLAFVGGMTLQLMPPKVALAAGAMPLPGDCSHMAMPPDDTGAAHKAPRKGMDYSECIKQMGCLGTPSLLPRLGTAVVPIAYTMVAYWTPALSKYGRSIKPDLFPPIGL